MEIRSHFQIVLEKINFWHFWNNFAIHQQGRVRGGCQKPMNHLVQSITNPARMYTLLESRI